VGNVFQLKTKYSTPFGLTYADVHGEKKEVCMGCYGIGISRLMGILAEVYHDEKGLMWPNAVAPFRVHLVALYGTDMEKNNEIEKHAQKVYTQLQKENVEVLFDDRKNMSAGEKFAESDLLGIPWRLVISAKTQDQIEIKKRNETSTKLVSIEEVQTLVGVL
jgi:prolyl-tRNA synthetase